MVTTCLRHVCLLASLLTSINAQSVTLSASQTTTSLSVTASGADYATGSELTYNSNQTPVTLASAYTYTSGSHTIVVTGGIQHTVSSGSSLSVTRNSTTSGTVLLGSSSRGNTVLSGSVSTTATATNGTSNSTASATSAAVQPTNTRPCNGYPELCNRKYSNITHVAAHNSPFVQKNNVASNQALDVTTQLNDGIRMLQFQVHKPNTTSPLVLCHTNCNLLYAGTLVDYLSTVKTWLDNNRYDVVTILMGNYDVLAPANFTGPVSDAGLLEYAYIPETVPMGLDGWPTLAEMILTNKRAVIMLDYEADQTTIPWLLDEFSYVWETPFSPTDRAFPCTVDRPPNQDRNISEDRMSLANHNLNIDIAFAGLSILVPAYNLLNVTNAVSGYGSAGAAISNCTAEWQRPPNFLLVDYYNIGNFNGSTLAVAAEANNVTYKTDSCCGTVSTSFGIRLEEGVLMPLLTSLLVILTLMV